MWVSPWWCFGAKLLVSFICIYLFPGSWICFASDTWLLPCTVVLHTIYAFFYFLFLSIPFPIHTLLILHIFLNIILLLCLYNLLPPWYDNSSLISSHFLHEALVSTSLFMDSIDPCSCLNVEGDFPLYIYVQLLLNFKTSSANQVSCCRYEPEWCYLVAERDCRRYSYWVASNGRLTLMASEDELDLPQYFAGYLTKFVEWIIYVAPSGRFIFNVEF